MLRSLNASPGTASCAKKSSPKGTALSSLRPVTRREPAERHEGPRRGAHGCDQPLLAPTEGSSSPGDRHRCPHPSLPLLGCISAFTEHRGAEPTPSVGAGWRRGTAQACLWFLSPPSAGVGSPYWYQLSCEHQREPVLPGRQPQLGALTQKNGALAQQLSPKPCRHFGGLALSGGEIFFLPTQT